MARTAAPALLGSEWLRKNWLRASIMCQQERDVRSVGHGIVERNRGEQHVFRCC